MVGSYKVERLVRHKHFSLTWLVIDWITLRVLYLTDPVLAFVRLANTASVKQITLIEKKKRKKNCLTETNINKDNLSTSTVQLLFQSPSKVVRSLGSCRRWYFYCYHFCFCYFALFVCFVIFFIYIFFLLFCLYFFFLFCFVFNGGLFCFDSYSDVTAR